MGETGWPCRGEQARSYPARPHEAGSGILLVGGGCQAPSGTPLPLSPPCGCLLTHREHSCLCLSHDLMTWWGPLWGSAAGGVSAPLGTCKHLEWIAAVQGPSEDLSAMGHHSVQPCAGAISCPSTGAARGQPCGPLRPTQPSELPSYPW